MIEVNIEDPLLGVGYKLIRSGNFFIGGANQPLEMVFVGSFSVRVLWLSVMVGCLWAPSCQDGARLYKGVV